MNDQDNIIITKHAEQRIRKRYKIPKKSVKPFVQKAVNRGSIVNKIGNSFNVVFNFCVFVFKDGVLVTSYLIPKNRR